MDASRMAVCNHRFFIEGSSFTKCQTAFLCYPNNGVTHTHTEVGSLK